MKMPKQQWLKQDTGLLFSTSGRSGDGEAFHSKRAHVAPLNKLEKGTPPGESSPVGTWLCKHVILLWKVKGLTLLHVHSLRSRVWIEFQSLN